VFSLALADNNSYLTQTPPASAVSTGQFNSTHNYSMVEINGDAYEERKKPMFSMLNKKLSRI